MDENTKQLVLEYEKSRKRTLEFAFFIGLIVAGVVLIITAFLFRTQYPFSLENKGKLHFSYSHLLMRDETAYNAFNSVKHHEIKYYIVYRNGSIYYEQETGFSTYSAHARKENVQPGITNHSVIKTSVERYTFLAKDGRTYCYAEPKSMLGALFDASYAGGKIYLRFASYAAGAAMIVFAAIQTKKLKTKETEKQL